MPRWFCPSDKHPSVIGPTKPRRDDIRRFCLPCSVETGKLVPRIARALEAKREKAEEKRKESTKAARMRKRQQIRKYYTIDGHDLISLLWRIWSLPTAKEWRARSRAPEHVPGLRVRRVDYTKRMTPVSKLGHAAYGAHEIMVVADAAGGDLFNVLETLIHEVAHLVIPHHAKKHHTPTFYACEKSLIEEWNVRYPELTPKRRHSMPEPIEVTENEATQLERLAEYEAANYAQPESTDG